MRTLKKSKQFVDFMKNYNPSGRVLVVMHDNPDPDCLASGLVLKRLFEDVYKLKCTLAYGGVIGRAENRKMVSECGISVERMDSVKVGDYSLVVTIDSQPGGGNSAIRNVEVVHLVIDHHPRKDSTRKLPWIDIRPKYGVTATIVLEYLIAHGLDATRAEATALLYALRTETQDLGVEASPSDRRAYLYLLPRADFNRMFNIVHAEVSRDYFHVLARALENARVHNDVMISNLGETPTPEHVAEVADMLLRLRGVRWMMVSGVYRNQMFLSIRTNIHDANAGDVMQHVVEGLGTGGGHDMMSGGRVPFSTDDISTEDLEQKLSTRFLRALRKRSQGEVLLEDKSNA